MQVFIFPLMWIQKRGQYLDGSEKWKLSIDNEGFVVGVLLDLSKVFGTINQLLLLAKLHAICQTKNKG